jgi:hypothetical protein
MERTSRRDRRTGVMAFTTWPGLDDFRRPLGASAMLGSRLVDNVFRGFGGAGTTARLAGGARRE